MRFDHNSAAARRSGECLDPRTGSMMLSGTYNLSGRGDRTGATQSFASSVSVRKVHAEVGFDLKARCFVSHKTRSKSRNTGFAARSHGKLGRLIERLAPTKLGIVVMSSSGDAELGDFDDRQSIRAGRLLAPSGVKRS